ncbi:hypothetical protein ACNOYE_37505 [Nannocystaceae bacterium ST9]
MPVHVKVFRVLIASPGDVSTERDLIVDEMNRWNMIHGVSQEIIFLPCRWEESSVPELGGHPQEIINRQLVDNVDGLIGVFWTKLGSKTPNNPSGTAEEIVRVSGAGKTCRIYICERAVPFDLVSDEARNKEFMRLKEYKDELFKKGLMQVFLTPDELRTKLNDHLGVWARAIRDADVAEKKTHDRVEQVIATGPAQPQPHAQTGEAPIWERISPGNARLALSELLSSYSARYAALVESPEFWSADPAEAVGSIESVCTEFLPGLVRIARGTLETSTYGPLCDFVEGLAVHDAQSGKVWRNHIRAYGALLVFFGVGIAQLETGDMRLSRRLAEWICTSAEAGKRNPLIQHLRYSRVFADNVDRYITPDAKSKMTPVGDRLMEVLRPLFSGMRDHRFKSLFNLFELLFALKLVEQRDGLFLTRASWDSATDRYIIEQFRQSSTGPLEGTVPFGILSFFGDLERLKEVAANHDKRIGSMSRDAWRRDITITPMLTWTPDDPLPEWTGW